MKKAVFLALTILFSFRISAYEMPKEKDFLNQKISDITVMAATGERVSLFSLFKGMPVVISPIYTRCPKACSVITAGLQNSVEKLGTLGKDFTIVTFSFDHTDKAADLKTFMDRWKMDNDNWRIVSADSIAIQQLLTSLDFHYDFDPVSGQYEHPNIVIMLSADGRIMQYVYGMSPKPRDIKLAALNAKKEQATIGIVEGFYLKCFQYDPVLKTYKIDWSYLIQLFAGLLILFLVSIMVVKSFLQPNRNRQREVPSEEIPLNEPAP